MQLIDDGAMDTVVRCCDCGHTERYTFLDDNEEERDRVQEAYDLFELDHKYCDEQDDDTQD